MLLVPKKRSSWQLMKKERVHGILLKPENLRYLVEVHPLENLLLSYHKCHLVDI